MLGIRIRIFVLFARSGSDFDDCYLNNKIYLQPSSEKNLINLYEINALCRCDLLIFYSKILSDRSGTKSPEFSIQLDSEADPDTPILVDRIRI